MIQSFWKNKPVEIIHNKSRIHEQILPTKVLLEKLETEISESKTQLDYIVYNGQELSESKMKDILMFINKYYLTSNCKTYSLIYTYELLHFYCKNALIIEFYPKNTNKQNNTVPIGYIFGKKTNIKIYGNEFSCLEVNFLCIMPVLRKLKLSSYMINILSKECIIKYDDITLACYTIQAEINSPSFCQKQFYHRLLSIETLRNCQFLPSDIDMNLFKKVHNTFKYNIECKSQFRIKYIYNGMNDNTPVDSNLIKILYEKYIEYSSKTYDIYQNISFEEFSKTFYNKSFYHFIIYKDDTIVSYICMFRIDVLNSITNLIYRNGYLYYMFFEENHNTKLLNKQNYLEFIHEFIYHNNIFDLTSFTDIFDIDYNIVKCIPGSGTLSYYLFNMKLNVIKNSKNGLITI